MKKHFWTVAMVLGLSSQASYAQSTTEGLRYLEQEQYSNARKALQEFFNKNQTAEGAYYLGYFYLQTEQADSAKIFFEKGVAIDAKYPLNHVGLGTVKYMNNNVDGAKADFEQAITLSKRKNAEVLHQIGKAYFSYEKKDFNAALDALEGNKAAKLKGAKDLAPQDAEIALTTGDAYLERNDIGKQDGGSAANSYERALQINPKSAKAYIRKGNIWVRAKNYMKAVEDYKKGIEIDPTYSPAYRFLGDLYIRAGRYKEGLQYYSDYMKRSDGNVETEYKYGQFLCVAKDYAKSYEVLKKLEGKIDRPNIHRIQAYNQYELKNYAEGLTNIETFVSKVPADKLISSDFEYMGRLYLANGKDTLKAIDHFLTAAQMDTTKRSLNTEIFNGFWSGRAYKYAAAYKEAQIAKTGKGATNDYLAWGMASFQAKDYAKADTVLAVANKMQETTNGVLYRARSKDRLDTDTKKGLAKPFWERLIEMADKNNDKEKAWVAEAYYGLARIGAAKGDAKQAEELAKKSLEFVPDYKAAKNMLEQLEALKKGGANAPKNEPKKDAPKK